MAICMLSTRRSWLSTILLLHHHAGIAPSVCTCASLKTVTACDRNSIVEGESLQLKVIVLSEAAPAKLGVYWRPLGEGELNELALTHVGRGVYRAVFPASAADGLGLEYYVMAKAAGGEPCYFPATAPAMNQTVVIAPALPAH